MCLFDINTSSRINIITFSIKYFLASLGDWKLPKYSYNLMKFKSITFLRVISIEFEKLDYFLSYYSIESMRHNSFKVYKFSQKKVHGKIYTNIFKILVNLNLVTLVNLYYTSLSKIDIDINNQEFSFWICPIKLFFQHNSLILKHKCTFIWNSYHFVLFFSILSQKEKFYIKRKNNTQSSCMSLPFFLVFYVGWTCILRG